MALPAQEQGLPCNMGPPECVPMLQYYEGAAAPRGDGMPGGPAEAPSGAVTATEGQLTPAQKAQMTGCVLLQRNHDDGIASSAPHVPTQRARTAVHPVRCSSAAQCSAVQRSAAQCKCGASAVRRRCEGGARAVQVRADLTRL